MRASPSPQYENGGSGHSSILLFFRANLCKFKVIKIALLSCHGAQNIHINAFLSPVEILLPGLYFNFSATSSQHNTTDH